MTACRPSGEHLLYRAHKIALEPPVVRTRHTERVRSSGSDAQLKVTAWSGRSADRGRPRAIRDREAHLGAAVARRLSLSILVGLVTAGFAAGEAHAYVVRGADGRLYGILPAHSAPAWRARVAGQAPTHKVTYWGGSVMLSSTLRLIFWGPPGSFAPSYQGSITQWAQDLATDSGKTTNEFSVASLYYTTKPRRQISRNVYFAGAVSDTGPYPSAGCRNPTRPRRPCLSAAQVRGEIARVITDQHWPRDNPRDPRNQYLLFTPSGVDTCQDRLGTTCTYSGQNSICGYHSGFAIGRQAIVYSLLPDVPGCPSGQSPTGVAGNRDADGAIDSAIHEVLESATDPGSRGANDWGWADTPGNEIGDLCSLDSDTVYGTQLGGSLSAGNAFNQVIAGHAYYTQEIWAIQTLHGRTAGCVQRVGPSPVFNARTARVNARVSFDGTRSYDVAGRITRYVWNYGDGSPFDTTHGARGVHVYGRPGVYPVSLTVQDASGPQNATTQTQTVVAR